MQRLEVPHACAGLGVERDRAVGEKICTVSVASVEIEGSRAETGENQTSVDVNTETTPSIRCTTVFPRIALPSLVTKFPRTGHRAKPPDFAAAVNVKGADVAGRCKFRPFAAGDADD